MIGLVLVAVAMGAVALAWNAYTPEPGAGGATTEVAAPAARAIFPKVLNQ